jgi:hypothetical protein
MLVEASRWSERSGWKREGGTVDGKADLVLYFGDRDVLRDGRRFADLRAAYPGAHVVGGSTGATILGRSFRQGNIVATALRFARTRIRVAVETITTKPQSRAGGEALARSLAAPDLAAVFVLADGMTVNGSLLTAGLKSVLGDACAISGGMTGDACQYLEAFAGADAAPASNVAVAVGFYGPAIRTSYGRGCGWDAFGPRRRITRSEGNVLYELDGKPAFELYERYLGDEVVNGVPAGVLFPLLLSHPDRPERSFVRAALGLDQSSAAMTLAGNVPEGWMARLMRGSLDRLALAAAQAARDACNGLPAAADGDSLLLVVSCTGRMLLMGQRTVEEVDFATENIPPHVRCLGFYSYGEIAPTAAPEHAELHNQTMTITGLAEVAA